MTFESVQQIPLDLLAWKSFIKPVIYHYCSAESFFNIIQTKTIRLTDTSRMNDMSECLFFYQYFKEWINKVPCQPCQGELKKRLEEAVWENTKPDRKKNFCACFTEDGDSLNMWKIYADQCRGFVIGIDTEALKPLVETIPNLMIGAPVRLSLKKVMYSRDAVRSIFDTQLLPYLKSLDQSEKSLEEKLKATLVPFIFIANHLYPSIKHPCFAGEHEVRLVYQPVDFAMLGNPNENLCYREEKKSVWGMDKLSVSSMEFCPCKSGIRQFYNLDFSEMPELPKFTKRVAYFSASPRSPSI